MGWFIFCKGKITHQLLLPLLLAASVKILKVERKRKRWIKLCDGRMWKKQKQDTCSKLWKQLLTTSPILAFPNETNFFIIDCDTSAVGLGCVLSQIQNDEEKVIAYFSKTLNKSERNYSKTHRELLAIVESVKHFRHYLLGKTFLIRTDHSSLVDHTDKVPWRSTSMVDQSFRSIPISNWIPMQPGRFHGNADGLSRCLCDGIDCKQCERVAKHMDKKPCMSRNIGKVKEHLKVNRKYLPVQIHRQIGWIELSQGKYQVSHGFKVLIRQCVPLVFSEWYWTKMRRSSHSRSHFSTVLVNMGGLGTNGLLYYKSRRDPIK